MVGDGADTHQVLDRVTTVLGDEYHVAHSTIQCEPAGHTDRESPITSARRRKAALVVAATGALAVDAVTKVAAVAWLADGPVGLGPPLTLRLVHNRGIAFGVAAAAPAPRPARKGRLGRRAPVTGSEPSPVAVTE